MRQFNIDMNGLDCRDAPRIVRDFSLDDPSTNSDETRLAAMGMIRKIYVAELCAAR